MLCDFDYLCVRVADCWPLRGYRLLSGALNELMTQQPSTSSSLQAASTQHVLPVQTALAEITRHQELVCWTACQFQTPTPPSKHLRPLTCMPALAPLKFDAAGAAACQQGITGQQGSCTVGSAGSKPRLNLLSIHSSKAPSTLSQTSESSQQKPEAYQM